ncbi:hypothetical protein [Heliorestis acidaminivorans]|nr:hypothetical protein [Heliorestis acidaminivorans]
MTYQKDKKKEKDFSFPGQALSESIALLALIFLLIFGSKDIKDLTDAPE